MTEAVTHGADTDRLATVATALGRQADRTIDVAMVGSGSMALLLQVWDGADAEHFARDWTTARQHLDAAAAHLRAAATQLRAQADDQQSTSASGSGPGGASHPFAEEDDDDRPDKIGGDIGIDLGWIGSGQLPPGLDPSDEIVRDLMLTPEGRAWLRWLTANGITVEIGGSSSHYEPANDTIVLATDAGPTSLIHEASHAQWDINGDRADIRGTDRDEYVTSQIDNEVAAVAAEMDYLLATGEEPPSAKEGFYDSFTDAYDGALADGASPEEAEAAGRDAIRELFVNGDYVPSGYEDSTYADFYGDQWDEANRWVRSGS